MSVLAQQWHSGSKRGYQDPHSENEGPDGGGSKARRLSGGFTARSSRSQPLGERQAYTVGAQTVAALRALFPSMNDRVCWKGSLCRDLLAVMNAQLVSQHHNAA